MSAATSTTVEQKRICYFFLQTVLPGELGIRLDWHRAAMGVRFCSRGPPGDCEQPGLSGSLSI